MGIDNYLKVIKEGVFGRDVRQAIHDGIEQTYEDATTNGNANMEVAKARGYAGTLADRLDQMEQVDKSTAQDVSVVSEQIDNLIANAGDGTVPSELTDIRVAFNGKNYTTAGEAVREQFSNVEKQLSILNSSIYYRYAFDDHGVGYLSGSKGGKIGFADTSGTWYWFRIKISDNGIVTRNTPGGQIKITDEAENILFDTSDYPATTTQFNFSGTLAKYIYFAYNNSNFETLSKQIISNLPNQATNDSLTVPVNAIIQRDNVAYTDIKEDMTKIELVTKKEKVGASSLIDNNTINVTGDYGGIQSNYFATNSSKVDVILSGTATGSVINVYYQYLNSSNENTFVKVKNVDVVNGNFSCHFNFDATSLIQYQSATAFSILVTSNSPQQISFDKFSAIPSDALMLSPYYDSNLRTMLQNMVSGIESANAQTQNYSLTLKSADGTSFIIKVSNDGQVLATPIIPENVLFLGNSLIFGWDNNGSHGGAFGMASSSPDKDFVYLVQQAIETKSPNAVFDKLYSSPFEHSETIQASQSFIDNNASRFIGKDLIIIEMGDNVNTPAKQSVFEVQFPKLITKIFEVNPVARIIVAGIWFNRENVKQVMLSTCQEKYVEFVDISPIRKTATEAVTGTIATYRDGTNFEITEGTRTHPGDEGMRLIAEAIIAQIGI